MSNVKIKPDQLAETIMKGMEEYVKVTTEDMKEAVTETAKDVKNEVKANAPKKTGRYRKSWAAKKTKENATALEITVHSRKRYMLTHLLENGHAKRGGGRTRAFPHIGPAEAHGEKELVGKIEDALKKG